MRRFLFFFLLIGSNLQSGEDESGFWHKIGSVACAPISSIKFHLENHGAGKQALKEVDHCFDIMKEQQKNISIATINNSLAAQAIEKFADSSIELAKVHAERNDILGGALQVGQAVGTVYSVVYIGKAGIDLARWVYHYFRPTQESILRKKLVEQELKIMEIRAELNKCLSQNIDIHNSFQGMPAKCESSARDFLQIAGKKKYNKVIKALETQD